ncbi:probable serine/threonine-protein kinase At1g01540 [Corylus avellana]|uniref:probable serine/threonine-protein kinase At1g01540 n=1 Tax=Corylus avellana TaxID=13451 RepID=UPI001E237B36|nr:probable serine/threonine-protein kinase At1g01540 [Corylus avellana]
MSLSDSISRKLFKHTSFLGLPLWVLIILSAFFVVLILIFISLCFICRRRRRKSYKDNYICLPNPIPCKPRRYDSYSMSSLDRRLLPRNIYEAEMSHGRRSSEGHIAGTTTQQHFIVTDDVESILRYLPVAKDVWRGSKFSLKEIEMATNSLAKENLIGSGDYGVVYRGILLDNTRVAVKKLVRGSCQAEDFIAEVEAFGQVRHKNLVKLLGYCIEGAYRMLVYEYVDNGNLYQWLHGSPEISPLTWSIRKNIIQGIAKGLAYLHEDLEPNVLHGCLKSSNILFDQQWNPKITDFGLAKLFDPEWSHLIMETLGYVAPESPSTDAFTEETDVYSFGILVMEIVSGLIPVDSRQPQPYLIEWFKSAVANREISCVVDPKLPEMPSSKALKRIILVALHCVDPNINHRPKMGDVVHMLEQCDMLLNNDCRIRRETSSHDHPEESLVAANRTNRGEGSKKSLPALNDVGNESTNHEGQ